MAEAGVKLFRTWTSPYAFRIVWALKLKGIEFETIIEDLSNKSPLFLHYNPLHKKVPVLVHNGKPICESLVILDYIEDTWKQNPLLPQHPYDKANARFWAKFNDDKLLPSVWGVFLKQGQAREEATAPAIENLRLVEEQLKLKGKIFFGGERIGFLDVVFGWMANVISLLEELTGLKLMNKEKFPLLCAWMENFLDVPLIKENCPHPEKLISKFQSLRETYNTAVPYQIIR